MEQKTELQAIKHQHILREFESLKNRPSLIDDSAPIRSTRILKSDSIDETSAQIVRAKYHYEPLKSSPNEHPEIELPLNVGEFYLIYGEIDEVKRKIETNDIVLYFFLSSGRILRRKEFRRSLRTNSIEFRRIYRQSSRFT